MMRRSVLAIIREKFDALHAELKGLTVDERVPVPGEQDVTVSYEHLLGLEEDGIKEYRPEGMRRNIRIIDLLSGVEKSSARRLRRDALRPETVRGRAASRMIANRTQRCRILFLAADPSSAQPLALDEECREVDQKIRASEFRDRLEVISKWAVRPDDLLQYLNQYRPQIVHFSGHGTKNAQLILLDRNRQPKAVSKAAIKKLFETMKDSIRVVVLNACFSKDQAEAIVQVIDCAIGMKKEIGDAAAIIFAAAFYRAIGFGNSVGDAFDQGISAIMIEGIPEEDIPVLLTKPGLDTKKLFVVGRPQSE
jgi:hypothetical protein